MENLIRWHVIPLFFKKGKRNKKEDIERINIWIRISNWKKLLKGLVYSNFIDEKIPY